MIVSPMEFSYPNDHLEDHKGDGHVTRTDEGGELTDHASIPTGSMLDKMSRRDHSDRFDDEGLIIEPKSDTEGKEPVVDGKQDIVRGSPKCYRCSTQLVQLKHPPRHRE